MRVRQKRIFPNLTLFSFLPFVYFFLAFEIPKFVDEYGNILVGALIDKKRF